ncbi:ABC transporter permease [Spirochaetia bacterium]|nr:ABC transporter permease [Spirochaetia bacterium]
MDSINNILIATLRMLPPILLAGMGGMISSRVGLLNMGLEGMMLIGSFVAVITSYFTGQPYLALLITGISGGIFGLLFALFIIKFKANNIVVSVAVNMLALGFTTYMLKIFFGVRGAFSDPKIIGLSIIHFPIPDKIPLFSAFNNHSILVYISLILVIFMQYFMYHTPAGLRMRATGQHDMAVTTAGGNVKAIRYTAIMVSGILCGLGGAHLSIGHLSMYTDNMTNGRGFIAMAAAVFGKNTPIGTFLGALLFSFTDAVTMKIQTGGFPPLLVQMIPYVLTLITLLVVAIQTKRREKTQ